MAADGTSSGSTQASVSARLEVPGAGSFEVAFVRLSEGLSERTHAEVEVATHEDVDWAATLFGDSTLHVDTVESATRAPLATRTWTLKVGEARFVEHKDNELRFVLRLWDRMWPLGLGLSTRKFRNMTARDIVSKVLSEASVPHEWQTETAFPLRKYTAQYRETNLAFVERLLEFEGVYYSFRPDGTVVFADASPAAERLRGGAPYELIEAAQGMARGDVGFHELKMGGRVTTGRVLLGDYSWKKPSLALRESAEGEADASLERYEYPAGFRTPEQGLRLAVLRCEAHRVNARFLDGRGNDPAFGPGFGVRVGGMVVPHFEGEYLLTHVDHVARAAVFEEGKAGTDASNYENRFRAIPLDRPFRPMQRTPRPTVAGTHTAMVRGPAGEEIHTDKYGRFRAQLHWDRDAVGTDEDSRWMRYIQESSSSMVLARMGWEVIVGYIDGDPDRPVGLGRAINGQMTPQYGQPANKNMMSIQTPSSPATGGFSEIKMDDSAGAQHISLQAEKDFDAITKNDKTETILANETHDVGADFKREIQGSQTVSIGGNDSATFNDKSELKVGGSRTMRVGGSESVKVGGGQHQTITKSDSEKVGAVRLNVIGSVVVPNFKQMAQQALKGLNPVAALQAGLKNPFQSLLPDLEKKITSLPDTLLANFTKLPSELQDKVLGALKEQGQTVAKDAFAKAKEAYKQNGLGAALDAGTSALLSGADKALKGLPDTLSTTVKETVQGTLGQAQKDALGVVAAVQNLPQAAQAKAAEFVQTLLPNFGQKMPDKMEGLGGILPSMDQLKGMYSAQALAQGLQGKVEGALNSATGGLFDSFFPKGQNGQRAVQFGWDQIDKLVDMFTKGGVSETAVVSIKKMVGGAAVQAAIKPITWGSKIGWMETVGGLKFTKSPLDVDQKVLGKMQVTVLGKASRSADESLLVKANTSKVTVGAKITWDVGETIEIKGDDEVHVKAADMEIVGAEGSVTMSSGGAVKLKGPKFSVEATKVVLGGNKLKVAK